MTAKLIAAIGAAVFAVFIVLYRINAQRAALAASDLGSWGGIAAAEWQATAEWQLGLALVGLVVAAIALWAALQTNRS